MTCPQAIRELIGHHGDTLPADVVEHLTACDSCRRLLRTLDDGDSELNPVAAQLHRIKSVLLEDLRAVEPLPSSANLLCILSLLSFATLTAGTMVVGAEGWQALDLSTKLLVFVPLLLCACLMGLGLVRQMVPGNPPPTRPVAWSASTFALLVAFVTLSFARQQDPQFVPIGLNCFGVGVLYAEAAAFTVWLVARRGAMAPGPYLGALTGGLAGLIALAGIEIRCPSPNGNHILAWHLPLALVGVLGGLGAGAVRMKLAFRDQRI